MLHLRKLAITGCIASGKSAVCSYFRECGAYVVSSDLILHDAFNQNRFLKSTLIQLLGETILEYGSISRKRIADIIFSNKELLHAVETVCHDYLLGALQTEYEKAQCTNALLFVAEVPLLYESPSLLLRSWFDMVVYVSTSSKIRKQRYLQLGQSEEEFTRRDSRFLPDEAKRLQADFCLENVGTLDELQSNVVHLFQHIQQHNG